ncbi:MAG: hypothetical protein ACOYVK_15065 [Bacillota bacterium]
MKKIIILSLVAVMVLSMGAVAFAETKSDVPSWYNDMLKWKKDQIDQAVKDKVITEEQAKFWNAQLDSMEQFHTQYGFGPGACHGGFNGNGSSIGFGPGMMGGYGSGMMGY